MPSCQKKNIHYPKTPQYVFLVTHAWEVTARKRSRSGPYLRLWLWLLLLWRAAIRRWCQSRRRIRQVPDSFDEPGLFVVELIVVRAVCEEVGQEFEQALFVHDEEFLHFVGFVGVCGEDLEGEVLGQSCATLDSG